MSRGYDSRASRRRALSNQPLAAFCGPAFNCAESVGVAAADAHVSSSCGPANRSLKLAASCSIQQILRWFLVLGANRRARASRAMG